MGELLWEIRDANVPLLEIDSDEWRGEEGLHDWIPLGTSVSWSEPVPVALGSVGLEGVV